MNKKNERFVKIIFSIFFFILANLSIFSKYFRERLNFFTIILLIISFLPWIINYIKTFELNGVGKIELFTKEEKNIIEENIEKNQKENGKKFKEYISNKKKEFITNEFFENNVLIRDLPTTVVLEKYEIQKKILELINKYKLSDLMIQDIEIKINKLLKNKIINNYEYKLLDIFLNKYYLMIYDSSYLTHENVHEFLNLALVLNDILEYKLSLIK